MFAAICKFCIFIDLPIKHHSKSGVTPVEVLDVFPDFNMWKFPFAQVCSATF